MRVYLGSDHAGFELKEQLREHVIALGYEAIDCGVPTYDPEECPLCRKGVPLNEEFVRRRTHRKSSSVQEPKAS